jgi:hypothetical protein
MARGATPDVGHPIEKLHRADFIIAIWTSVHLVTGYKNTQNPVGGTQISAQHKFARQFMHSSLRIPSIVSDIKQE